MIARNFATAAMLLTLAMPAFAESVGPRVDSAAASFRVVRLLTNLDHPWSMSWLPNGDALIATRPGDLLRWRPGGKPPIEIQNVPSVAAFGQGGLFDVKPAPDFAKSQRIVFAYAYLGVGEAATRVAEAKLNGNSLSQVKVLFEAGPRSGSAVHYGGRLRFDRDGALYASFGDRGSRDRAQDPKDAAGTVYRIPQGGKPELFSMGHRNPQGMAVHPTTGAIWEHEHGPRGGDEVNILKRGGNYGWPRYTYGREYSGGKISDAGTGPGFEAPLYYWDPSIAPSGMAFYQGDAFPGWKNSLFVGSLKFRLLARLELDGDRVVQEERLIEDMIGRIREVSVGPDGLVYLLTDADDSGLYRLEPL